MFTIVGILAIQQKYSSELDLFFNCSNYTIIMLWKKIKQISVLKIKENTKKDVNFDSENFQNKIY